MPLKAAHGFEKSQSEEEAAANIASWVGKRASCYAAAPASETAAS